MPIRILDAATIGKIAAGEVVERPSSVVKELMENALDAGATSITVEIRDGGITHLRVTDNGCGIEPGQVRLAFENHATSKLISVENLSDIRTLGFRGEALPSIAAVSRVEMTTRAQKKDIGVRLTVEGGENLSVREIGCPEGTTVIMKDIFFNLPVRQSFLKKPQYEGALVNDAVARMILGNPNISFRYINNGRTVYHSFGDGELRHAVFAVYGRETAENMLDINRYEGGLRIEGMIGVGDLAKSTRSHQAFFINGRTVRCQLLAQALESVCAERVTIGLYPMCALSLTLPPASVDVNVHPNKLEVRFRDAASTRLSVESVLQSAFENGPMLNLTLPKQTEVQQVRTVERTEVPAEQQKIELLNSETTSNQTEVQNTQTEVSNAQTEVCESKPKISLDDMVAEERRKLQTQPHGGGNVLREYGIPVTNPERMACDDRGTDAPIHRDAPVQPILASVAVPEQSESELPPYRVIGVLFRTYILLESGGAFLMIDQHAAHERLRYEVLKKAVEDGVASQQLLMPEIVRVSAREMTLVEDNMDALTEAGYDISPIGNLDLQIRAVPYILGRAELKSNFMETIAALSSLSSAALESRRAEILQKACKGAVKAGDTLSDSEISSLLRQMAASGAPPTCPHGRPVIKTISKREIERMFKRIQ